MTGTAHTEHLSIVTRLKLMLGFYSNWTKKHCFIFFFFRLLKDSNLSVLVLAGNTAIEASSTATLLLAAKDSKTLHTLNLSACGIKSPLDITFFHSLRTAASKTSSSCLRELDLSHNSLNVEDKQGLEREWLSSCTGESFVSLENSFCLFTK